jgi:cation diffusion facilitator CzcD-associated flavoprotein CzcO
MVMTKTYPLYPSREQVIEYLENYAAQFGIQPTFNTTVSRIQRDGTQWCADTVQGSEGYQGQVVHSCEYRNPTPYAGKRVLVVGFGNSGAEIALDLANAGIDVTLAVRSPVQILPRDLLGFPILAWAILYRRLPARLVDLINAPIVRLAIGPIERLGLRRAAKGPRQMVEEDGRVPLIDVGTLDKIRDGAIKICGGIDRLARDGVVLGDGECKKFDAIILATGFRPNLSQLIPDVEGVFDQHGIPLVTGRTTRAPGLYFCGQLTSPTGQLREIGLEAQRIANLAKRRISSPR